MSHNRYVRSHELMARAVRCIPGGVNSPVRAFRAVGGSPVLIASARGAWLTDVDGARYVDYVGAYGPHILGHNHPEVAAAAARAAADGFSFGASTEAEVMLAEAICGRVPSVKMVRLVNSGTEAAMSLLRVARAFTKRSLVVKFDGHYHGHCDSLLVAAGSGAETLGVPDSPGVPGELAKLTAVLPWNDEKAAADFFRAHGQDVACVIVEPIAGNMGVVPPAPGFLQLLRILTAQYRAILIFDEVMTGFRVHPGGAQALFGITPDLTAMGKVIGGGLPLAAYGGHEQMMALVAPLGPVYQAGTLSGNPLAVAAGLAALQALTPAVYERLETTSAAVAEILSGEAKAAGVPVQVQRAGSMLTPFFSERPVNNIQDGRACHLARFRAFFQALLDNGVFIPPSQYEAWFVSAAHDGQALEHTRAAVRKAMQAAAAG
ncbi:MAG: Glutamate-1-semialdehyde 2,1-aminomutase [Myxococcota bacterium]|nr:Glutamate-1-semialdehyde 2,1-aminomutase [Myxococcota bacterium]